jgi:uncharacterized damage-inducible protein DinB
MNPEKITWPEWLKLREELSSASKEFNQAANNLDPKLREREDTSDKWWPKDIVAHIAGWEIEVVKQFSNFLINPDVDDTYDIDSFNEESVSSRKHRSWDEIIEELKSAQKELEGTISSLSHNDLKNEDRFPEWVSVLINHYKHHKAQLEIMI